ncbi:MAG: DegQ family serine endoprotease [Burkholderiales bacterium]|nr:DegQ family serine endoprotease [Burkholderiales bacterium]
MQRLAPARSRSLLRPRDARSAVAAWLAAALLAGAAVAGAAPARAQEPPVPTVQLPDFSVLAERVGPSVVNIRTMERVGASAGAGFPGLDPNIEEFFRRFGIPLPGRPEPRGPRGGQDDEPRQRGVGSGFILSADGYVMTNAHVVQGADEVMVTLADKREFKARIVGADRRTDVAVVKIDASGLPAVRIGDVNRLKVGEWVLAIGSPFGLDNTVTAGIVSAKQRDTGDYLPFIQTDVAINPGNSGGPLLNLRGEVVGINSQIYSRSGGFMGISFAIPIDEAMNVADQLRAQGRVVRGRIGVQIAPVTKDVAEALGLADASGALVRGVEPDGPAAKGGLQAGDIITRVDGKPVERSADLPRLIGGTKPGTRSTIQVFRRGERKELRVTVGEFPADTPVAAAGSGTAPRSSPAAATALGLAVTDLGADEKKELGVDGGVRVESVQGQAARAGIQAGDVILQIGNSAVDSARQFAELAERASKDRRAVSVLVRRGDVVNFLLIRP